MNNKRQTKKQEDAYVKPQAKKVAFLNSDEKIGSAGVTTCAGTCTCACVCVCGPCVCA